MALSAAQLQIPSWRPSWNAIGRRGTERRAGMHRAAEILARSARTPTQQEALLELERDLRRLHDLKAVRDHFAWCRRYLARQLNAEPAPMHRRVVADTVAFLNREEPDPERFPGCSDKGVYALPRGHGKSTALGFSIPLRILYDWRQFDLFSYEDEHGVRQIEQRPFIVVVSNTETQSVDRVRQIRQEVERNTGLREAYGDRRPYGRNVRWGDSDFVTSDGCRVVAVGMDSSFRGLVEGESRPNVILLDDTDDKKQLTSAELREKNWRKVMEEVLGLPIEGESIVLAWGTVLHDDSILGRLLNPGSEVKGWVRRLYQALPEVDTEDQKAGEPAWPGKWSKQRLKKKKASIPPIAWQTEYQNNPADDSTTLFSKEKWLTPAMARGADRPTPLMPLPTVDDNPEEGFVLVLQAWDLAFTDDIRRAELQRGSFNVGGTLAVDQKGHLHICKAARVRGLDPTELEELITAEAALLVPDFVVIESNHAGHVYAHRIAQNTGVPIVTRYTGAKGADKRDLYRGIPALQRPFANGQIDIWCGDEHNRTFAKTLVEELHRFPHATHDDTVMMLWHAWSLARPAMMRAAHFRDHGMMGELRKALRVGKWR